MACQDSQRAIDNDQHSVKGHFFLGQALVELALYDEAIASFSRGKKQAECLYTCSAPPRVCDCAPSSDLGLVEGWSRRYYLIPPEEQIKLLMCSVTSVSFAYYYCLSNWMTYQATELSV